MRKPAPLALAAALLATLASATSLAVPCPAPHAAWGAVSTARAAANQGAREQARSTLQTLLTAECPAQGAPGDLTQRALAEARAVEVELSAAELRATLAHPPAAGSNLSAAQSARTEWLSGSIRQLRELQERAAEVLRAPGLTPSLRRDTAELLERSVEDLLRAVTALPLPATITSDAEVLAAYRETLEHSLRPLRVRAQELREMARGAVAQAQYQSFAQRVTQARAELSTPRP